MHVGLNLVYLVPGETGGTEVYARELIPRVVEARPDWRFTAFVNREAAEAGAGATWGGLLQTVTVPVRARRRTEWVRGEQQLLPRLATRAGVDLVHSLANTGPAWGRFARVVTVHDLIYRIHPEAHLGLLSLGMRVLVPLAARRSARVITGSHSSARDLARLIHVPEAKIDVVPYGLGARPAAPIAESELRARHALNDRPVVLSVLAKRPHKNLMRLIEAFARISSERRPTLVVPGYPTDYERELERAARELGVGRNLRLLGWVEPGELEALYAIASAFVFPSLYEGGGLPVLEAMSRGVPVACSDRSSLPEVAGDAALLFDPESVEQIAAAIERLLGDEATAARLRAAGPAQAARFSWEATAAGTVASYERALA